MSDFSINEKKKNIDKVKVGFCVTCDNYASIISDDIKRFITLIEENSFLFDGCVSSEFINFFNSTIANIFSVENIIVGVIDKNNISCDYNPKCY